MENVDGSVTIIVYRILYFKYIYSRLNRPADRLSRFCFVYMPIMYNV